MGYAIYPRCLGRDFLRISPHRHPADVHNEKANLIHFLEQGQDMDDRDKLEKIKKGIDLLSDNERKGLAQSLYKEIEFMHGCLEDFRKDIEEKGTLIVGIGSTGKTTTKANPSVNSYNTMIKNYSTVIRQITQLFDSSKGNTNCSAAADVIKDILGNS